MPISAEQWRAVVGSNNVRRPRHVSIRTIWKDLDLTNFSKQLLLNETLADIQITL